MAAKKFRKKRSEKCIRENREEEIITMLNDKYAARKSAAVLKITDREGKPVPGARVHAELKKHAFLFGTGAFFTVPLAMGRENAASAAPVRDAKDPKNAPFEEKMAYLNRIYGEWKSVFNYGTLPFYMARYEPEKGKTAEEATLKAADLLHADGKSVKGHPLCWHTSAAPWMYDLPEEEVLDYMLYRIRREIAAFKGDLRFWDVINEVVIMPEFVNEPASLPRMNPITRLCRKIGRVPLVKAVFDEAHAADPDATLLINDFNTSPRYHDLIRDCLNAGVPIGTIGIQSHQHQGFWGMDKLVEVVDRYEQFGLPIHFTENTFVSGHLMPPEIVDLNDYQIPEWPSTPEGEDRQANDVLTMLDYLFSRPLVQAFTTWDFEDAQWLGAPSGLIRKDGSKKPAFEALDQRINHDWHTEVEVMTDENGVCELTGFRGEYTLSALGRTASLTLAKDTPELTVTL